MCSNLGERAIHNSVISMGNDGSMDSRIERIGLWQIDASRGAKVDLIDVLYIYTHLELYRVILI